MNTSVRRRLSIAFAVLAFPLATFWATGAAAQEVDSPTREAAKHFQRGVVLYSEADYRSALVEFKRAYGLAPNAAVLYNVGETEYQLQDYASALTTFKRYLAESGATDSHRTEVEGNVEVLRTRVGHLVVTTTPIGAEVTIDDQLVGKTPFEEPILVSIGHRKVVAAIAGRPAVTRYVDVATDDNVSLSLALPSAPEDMQGSTRPQQSALPVETPAHGAGGATLRIVGWVATGAFAAGAVTFGLLANKEAGDLTNARNTFPTTSATLNHDASLTTTYSVIADSLTTAAVIVGGITLFSTLASVSSSAPMHGNTGVTRLMLGPTSARLESSF
jgi:tetratricopeptide (TPR) repeat protein